MSTEAKDKAMAAEQQQPLVAAKKKPLPAKLRYAALFLSCFLAFGGYLVFDLCSTLQKEIMDTMHIGEDEYSLLYVSYAWVNAVMVLFAGALIDKTKPRQCALIFTTVAFTGQSVLALGVHLGRFWLMIAGRVIFGMGLGSICVAQNTISNNYFRDADLATAFAATLTVSRLGSVTNFWLSQYIYSWFGSRLPMVFWWGASMTALSVVFAVLFFMLDARVERTGKLTAGPAKSRKIVWGDVLKFPVTYWILCVVCSLYYIGVFALMAVVVKYLMERNHYEKKAASMISSGIYLTAIPCVPLFGRIIDYFGKRMIFLAGSVATLLLFDAYMAFTTWTPIPGFILAGMSYSMVASSLWPSICMVVPSQCVGSANGIATSIQMIGIGASNLIVGALRKYMGSYRYSMIYLAACAALATVLSVLANFLDVRYHNGMLNKQRPLYEKMQAAKAAKADPDAVSCCQSTSTAVCVAEEKAPLIVNSQPGFDAKTN